MNHIKHRPPRPSPGQSGTLREQFAAIALYLRLPAYYRRFDPSDAWKFARQRAMLHARKAVA
ncbi:MAG: hypothetical protein DCC68_25310 [Planctomycetota bacterium]|nr:MAG: hypothetical protein DCC68_25310 [Planctomycetota bacterium]